MFGFGSAIQPSSLAKECAVLQEWKPRFRNIIYILQQRGWGGGLPRCRECGGWSFRGRPAGFQEVAAHAPPPPSPRPAGGLGGHGALLLLLVQGERLARGSKAAVAGQPALVAPKIGMPLL